MRTILQLFSVAALLLLSSVLPADDVPDFLAMAPSYAAPADDVPDFSAMDATHGPAAEAGDDCPCFEMLHCPTAKSASSDCDCEDCVCTEKQSRTVTKPAGVTMRLSAEAQARHDRRMARGADDRQLPADDPPPRPELKSSGPQSPRTQCLMFTADYLAATDGRDKMAAELPPKGWTLGEGIDAMYRIVNTPDAAELAAEYRISALPTFVFIQDGKEVLRIEKFPGVKELAEKFNAVKSGKIRTQTNPPQSASTSQHRGYPIKPGFENLRYDVNPRHHAQEGVHRGKFPVDYIAGLTSPEWNSLHDDHHKGRVKWEYVPGHQQQASAMTTRREPIYGTEKVCTPFGCVTKQVIVGYRNVN